jgi:Protein of unknown function (DUF2490)
MKRHLKNVVILCLLLNTTGVFAQTKNKQYQGSNWYRYNSNIQLPKKFLLKAELEERFFIAKRLKQHQFYFRFTIDKQLPKNWNIGMGFSSWYIGSNDELSPTKLMIPEWRPHFEINNRNKINERLNIIQRYRAEWRFIKNTNKEFTETLEGYNNSFRFRIMVTIDYAVYKKEERSLHLIAFDELFINAGKSIQRNIFDQNRVGFSVRYNFNKIVGAELGYINWIQQRPSGVDFFNRQILRCTLHTNFEINKKVRKKDSAALKN